MSHEQTTPHKSTPIGLVYWAWLQAVDSPILRDARLDPTVQRNEWHSNQNSSSPLAVDSCRPGGLCYDSLMDMFIRCGQRTSVVMLVSGACLARKWRCMPIEVLGLAVAHKNNTHANMTEAPPPATIVHMRPAGFKMVSFSDAPLLASRSAMYASYSTYTRQSTAIQSNVRPRPP